MKIGKCVFLVGSNNKNSFTLKAIKIIKEKFINMHYFSEINIIFLEKYLLEYCNGCSRCFYNGYCPIDESDDMRYIRNEINIADVLIIATPIYMLNIPGKLKSLIDRLTYHTHLMDFAGIIGFNILTASETGFLEVNQYLETFETELGIKVLNSYSIKDRTYDVNYLKENCYKIADSIMRLIDKNKDFSNDKLETSFNIKKRWYLLNYEHLKSECLNEIKYWNQNWIRECINFNEFSINIKEIKSKIK